jgi:DnaJ-class molecular chaperone
MFVSSIGGFAIAANPPQAQALSGGFIMRDPYSLLGVKRNADPDEIKAAWRTKAKSVHPDHNQDDPAATDRFAEVGQAYELLKDPERRKRYDKAADMHQTIMQQREAADRAKAARARADKIMEELARAQAARNQQQGESPKPQAAKADKADKETPEETIERIFGAGTDAKGQAQDRAAPAEDNGSNDDAATDGGKESGPAPAEPRPPLPLMAVDLISNLVSRLRGTAPLPEKAPDMFVDAKVTVAELLAQKPVTVTLPDEREIRVPIEAGSKDGQVVRLKSQGLKVPSMKQGDLVVTLKLARDRFQADDYDLHTVLPISLQDAVLGGDASVDTPDGPRTVAIPSWSGSDQSVRVPGLGLFAADGQRGDLVVELRIVLWEKPDAKVTDLMRHMRDGLYL